MLVLSENVLIVLEILSRLKIFQNLIEQRTEGKSSPKHNLNPVNGTSINLLLIFICE